MSGGTKVCETDPTWLLDAQLSIVDAGHPIVLGDDSDIQIIEPHPGVTASTVSQRMSLAPPRATPVSTMQSSPGIPQAAASQTASGSSRVIELDEDDDEIVALPGPPTVQGFVSARQSSSKDIRTAENIQTGELVDEDSVATRSASHKVAPTPTQLNQTARSEKTSMPPPQSVPSSNSSARAVFQTYQSPLGSPDKRVAVATPAPSLASGSRASTREPSITGLLDGSFSDMIVDIRAQIAQMRADGRLRPPPSILDEILPRSTETTSMHSESLAPTPTPERAMTSDSQSDVEAVQVKLERRDSDEDLGARTLSAGKGKKQQYSANKLPLLVRIERERVGAREGDTEGDEWDEILELLTKRLEEKCAVKARKLQAGAAKRLGRKAKAKREQESLQWVFRR